MRATFNLSTCLALAAMLSACSESSTDEPAAVPGTHVHADGTTHENHAEDQATEPAEDHSHDEVSLGSVGIGDIQVELAQGHGLLTPGAEGHLVVKLPYSDNGATTVRAWIGTEDRTLSFVGKGDYAPSHDDYDIHAIAPDPLPENVKWWIEIEQPNGTKSVGSAEPLNC
jgi:hypothetical protein